MPKDTDKKKTKDSDKTDSGSFLSRLTEAVIGGMAAGAADGGESYEAAKQARLDRIKPLYGRSFDPPPLNADGSLVNPDADTPKLLKGKGKKKAGKKPAAKTPAKKTPKKK